MRQLDEQKNGTQVGSHHGIPLLHRCLHQRLRDLDRSVIDQGIERRMEGARLLKDLLRGFGVRNIRLNEASVLREIVAKFGAIHTNYAPAIYRKVTYSCAPNPPSRASDQNSFCHRFDFLLSIE